MKSHTVKSNAKREARKLCTLIAGVEPIEPVEADGGGWWPAVKITGSRDGVYDAIGGKCVIHGLASDAPADNTAAAEGPLEIPAFLKRKAAESADADKIVAAAQAERAATAKTVKAVKDGLPPRAVSTPEEIAARREARRQRIADDKANPQPAPLKPAKRTMADVIVEMCARSEGASSEQLQEATGWQRHTLRGFIAGTLRKRGHAIVLDRAAKVYRVEQPTA